MAFRLGSKNTTGTVGRAAKPGETGNRKATPVTTPRTDATPAKGSKPRQQS